MVFDDDRVRFSFALAGAWYVLRVLVTVRLFVVFPDVLLRDVAPVL